MPGHVDRTTRSYRRLAAVVAAAIGLASCSSSAPKSAEPPPAPGTPAAAATEPPPPPPPPPVTRAKPPATAARPAPAPDAAPEFPWPPPQPSDLLVIPRRLLSTANAAPQTLAEVDARLSDALVQAGYTGNRYYAVPEGFAVVTRLERIDEHANPRPGDARWAPAGLAGTSLTELLKGLFRGNPGRYRVFVFTVTPRTFAPDTAQATRRDAERWLQGGMNALPADLGAIPFSAGHEVTALLYEFEQRHPDEVAALRSPATVPAKTQLERARIWRALGG